MVEFYLLQCRVLALQLLIQSFIFLANHADGVTLTDKPSNVALIAGPNVTLPCKSDAQSPQTNDWLVWFDNSGLVASTGPASSDPTKYAVTNNESGRYNLVVLNTVLGSSGNYKCSLFVNQTGVYFSAEVILLASNSQLTNNMTLGGAVAGEWIMVRCSVTYQGLWGPVSTLTRNSVTVSAIDESVAGRPSVSQYSYYFAATAADNSATFVCNTFFNSVTVSDPNHSASNTPSYTYTTSSQTITVFYPPQDFVISPEPVNGLSYYPGHQFTCSAIGNPAPAFYWLVVTANSTKNISGAVLTLTADMMGSVTATCEASNVIRGTLKTVASPQYQFTVLAPTTTTMAPTTVTPTTAGLTEEPSSGGNNDGLSGGAIAGIVIACVVVAALIVFLVIFFCCCRKSTSASEAKTQQQPRTVQQTRPAPNDTVRPQMEYYNSAGPDYASDYPPPLYGSENPYMKNSEGVVYADLAFDDQPRSRKPVQYLPSATSTSELNLSEMRY